MHCVHLNAAKRLPAHHLLLVGLTTVEESSRLLHLGLSAPLQDVKFSQNLLLLLEAEQPFKILRA